MGDYKIDTTGIYFNDDLKIDTTGIYFNNNLKIDATKTYADLSSDQNISGVKTFSNTILGSINGNAATATTAEKCTGNAATASEVAWNNVTSKPSTLLYTNSAINSFPTLNQDTNGNAETVTNGVYTTGAQTIEGVKTFSDTLYCKRIYSGGPEFVMSFRDKNPDNPWALPSETTVWNGVENSSANCGRALVVERMNGASKLTINYHNDFFYGVYITGNLHVSGNATCTGQTTEWSDDRLKHNETDISNALQHIRDLHPQHYIKTYEMYEADHHFNLDASGQPIDSSGNVVRHFIEEGLIAQDLLKLPAFEPFVSVPDNDKTPYAVNYNSIFVHSLKALQELDIEHTKTKTELEQTKQSLTETISNLESLLQSALSRITALETQSTSS